MNDRPDVGDRQALVSTFVENGVPTSPTSVVASCRSPSGTVVALTPAELSAGVWKTMLPTYDEGGVWTWRVSGTAGLIATDQGYIIVDDDVTASQ